jgi:hypothetical protein
MVWFDSPLRCVDLFRRLQFSDAFAFGADRLISHPVAIWMILYADQVIVSNQPSEDAVPNLLYVSDIGRHTSVTHLKRQDGGNVEVVRYIWQHRMYRPNSFSFPFVCPLCRCISPWKDISKKQKGDGAPFIMRCGTHEEIGGKKVFCKGTYDIPAAPPSSPVAHPYAGTWLQM